MLALIGSITFLVAAGKDYQGVIILLTSITVVAGQVINYVKVHDTGNKVQGVQDDVTAVKDNVNGRMTELVAKIPDATTPPKDNNAGS